MPKASKRTVTQELSVAPAQAVKDAGNGAHGEPQTKGVTIQVQGPQLATKAGGSKEKTREEPPKATQE